MRINRTIVLVAAPRRRRRAPARRWRSRAHASPSAGRPTRSGSGATSATRARSTTSATSRRGLRRQRPGHRDRAAHQGKLSKYVEVQARIHSRFNQNYWTNCGGFGGNPSTARTAPARAPRRLRRVRPAVEPVHQAPRRHGDPHPGLQLARLGHDRLERLGHVRPVRRRPDPLHRPRQRPGPPLPGLGASASRSRGTPRGSPCRASGPAPATTPATTTRPTRPTCGQFKYSGGSAWSTSAASSSGSTTSRSTRRTSTGTTARDTRDPVPQHRLRRSRSASTRARRSTSEAAFYYSTYESATDLAPAQLRHQRLLAGPRGQARRLEREAQPRLQRPVRHRPSFNVEAFHIGAEYVSMMAARRESDVLLTEGHDAHLGAARARQRRLRRLRRQPDRSSATAAGRGTPSRSRRSTSTTSSPTSTSRWPRRRSAGKGITIAPTFHEGDARARRRVHLHRPTTRTGRPGATTAGRSRTRSTRPWNPTRHGDSYRIAYAPFQDKKTDIGARQGQVRHRRRQGDRPLRQDQVHRRDRQAHERRPLPPVPAGRLRAAAALGCNGDEELLLRRQLDGATSTATRGVITGANGSHGLPVEAVRQPLRRRPRPELLHDPARRRLPVDRRPLRLARRTTTTTPTSRTATPRSRPTTSWRWPRASTRRTSSSRSSATRSAAVRVRPRSTSTTSARSSPTSATASSPRRRAQDTANNVHVPVGSLGFAGRYGGWNSLEKRDFDQQRLKAYMKILF